MKTHNCKNSFKKLTSLVGITSVSALLCLPVLAQPNPSLNNFNSSLSNRPQVGEFNLDRQFFAQSNTDGSTTNETTTENSSYTDRSTIRGSTFSVRGCDFVPIPRPSGGGTRERISTIDRCEQSR